MNLNNRGWGFKMMAFLMLILISFLTVAIIYIYKFYNGLSINNTNNANIEEVDNK